MPIEESPSNYMIVQCLIHCHRRHRCHCRHVCINRCLSCWNASRCLNRGYRGGRGNESQTCAQLRSAFFLSFFFGSLCAVPCPSLWNLGSPSYVVSIRWALIACHASDAEACANQPACLRPIEFCRSRGDLEGHENFAIAGTASRAGYKRRMRTPQ